MSAFSALNLASSSTPAEPLDFGEFDDILDDIRSRHGEIPQWEFCDGFLVALVCMRCTVPEAEVFEVLLDWSPAEAPAGMETESPVFASTAQQERFLALWRQRWREVATSLQTDVPSLQDPRAYAPSLVDLRAEIARLPEAEKAKLADYDPPSFGQAWAVGFMYAVESWPAEWVAPTKDKEAVALLNQALHALIALTEDDTGKPEIAPLHGDDEDDDGGDGEDDNGNNLPAYLPTTSLARMETFGAALWAVYDVYQLWKSIGPRVETVRRTVALPGRNDPCFCGSGKKYKKCHGSVG